MARRFSSPMGERSEVVWRLGATLALLTLLATSFLSLPAPLSAQAEMEMSRHGSNLVTTANYRLAARFAPYKAQGLLYSTGVTPNWIEEGDRFWYQWDNSDGTVYYLVDPARGTKTQIFDSDRIAAELTRITRDPWDGQHTGIQNLKFIDDNTIQFGVQSAIDEEIEEEEGVRHTPGPAQIPQAAKISLAA